MRAGSAHCVCKRSLSRVSCQITKSKLCKCVLLQAAVLLVEAETGVGSLF